MGVLRSLRTLQALCAADGRPVLSLLSVPVSPVAATAWRLKDPLSLWFGWAPDAGGLVARGYPCASVNQDILSRSYVGFILVPCRRAL